MAAGVAAAGALPRRRRLTAGEALRADDVPLPQRRPAHGACRGDRAPRRHRPLLVAAWLRGAQPDGLGLLRPAGRERRDPQRRAPGDLYLRQHRDPGRELQAVRRELRLVPPAAHLRPGVLPLDPVALPALLRARSGLPQGQPGQLVPQRPDGAGQRAGRRRPLRALRRRGHQARAQPVVLQDHRLRPGAARRPRRPGADLARPGGHRPAQLDRPLRGRARHLPRRRPADRRLHHAAGHAVRRDVHGHRRRRAPGRRAGLRRPAPGAGGLPGRGAQGLRHRPPLHRAAQDRRRPGRHRHEPGQRRADPRLGE